MHGKRFYVLLLLILFNLPSWVWADFSADQVLTVIRDGKREDRFSKTFSKGDKTRVEIHTPGRESIRIARKDKTPAVIWTLFPDQLVYFEFEEAKKKGPKKELLGVDTQEGFLCNKYRVTLSGPEGFYTGVQWEAIDLNHTPIRQEYQRGNELIVIKLKNIQIHPLEDTLFEIPEGFQRVDKPRPKKSVIQESVSDG